MKPVDPLLLRRDIDLVNRAVRRITDGMSWLWKERQIKCHSVTVVGILPFFLAIMIWQAPPFWFSQVDVSLSHESGSRIGEGREAEVLYCSQVPV